MATEALIKTMRALRDPDTGCPWDCQQTYHTIIPYTIEEAYEVADAIERADFNDLKNELGDLLFQVVFYCQIAQEENRFEFADVVQAVNEKLIVRHPHVFADEVYQTEQDLNQAWEAQKHQERSEKTGDQQASFLDDIPLSLPALKRAQKMQKRAAQQGFDWPDVSGVWSKINEEISEVKIEEKALQESPEGAKEQLTDEIGDLLFSIVNLSRFHKIDAENALRQATTKFEQRFRSMEADLQQQSKVMKQLTIEQLEALWQQAKTKI